MGPASGQVQRLPRTQCHRRRRQVLAADGRSSSTNSHRRKVRALLARGQFATTRAPRFRRPSRRCWQWRGGELQRAEMAQPPVSLVPDHSVRRDVLDTACSTPRAHTTHTAQTQTHQLSGSFAPRVFFGSFDIGIHSSSGTVSGLIRFRGGCAAGVEVEF